MELSLSSGDLNLLLPAGEELWVIERSTSFYVLATLILFLGITAIMVMPTNIFPQINRFGSTRV